MVYDPFADFDGCFFPLFPPKFGQSPLPSLPPRYLGFQIVSQDVHKLGGEGIGKAGGTAAGEEQDELHELAAVRGQNVLLEYHQERLTAPAAVRKKQGVYERNKRKQNKTRQTR